MAPRPMLRGGSCRPTARCSHGSGPTGAPPHGRQAALPDDYGGMHGVKFFRPRQGANAHAGNPLRARQIAVAA